MIHSCDANKAVRHVGATIASGEKIDVRLESFESFVEQMKGGSVRCWLAFLLIFSEIVRGWKKPSTKTASNDDDEEDNDEDPLKNYSSVLYYSSNEAIQEFCTKIIGAVKSLNGEILLSKLSETLAEDEQRVMKLMEDETQIAKAVKIMKHSMRLVFSALLIVNAMKPASSDGGDEDDADQDNENEKKSKANAKAVKRNNNNNNNKNAASALNGFRASINLKKDVFGIEDKLKNSPHSSKLFASESEDGMLKSSDVKAFYDQEHLLKDLMDLIAK